jgi:integrase
MGVFKRKSKDGVEGESWYADFRDPNGKRIIKAIGPKKDAEAYLGKVKAAIREGRFFDIKKEDKFTFKDLLDQYIPKVEQMTYYQRALQYFMPAIKEHFEGKLLSQITFKDLEDFRDAEKKKPIQHGTERSNRTVNIEMEFLRRIFNKAVMWEMLERSPFDRGEGLFYKNTLKRERALTEDEVKKLIEACPPYLKPIVISAIYTGLRKGDILSLKWKDVDLEKGVIQVIEKKTEKTRNIALNNDMRTLLKSLRVRGDYVFPGKNGKPFKDVKKSFQSALEDAGIEQSKDRRKKIVFHTLRHTCISLLTERGADTTMVKNYVAHASEQMTEHYTHLSQEYARKTADILNGLCRVEEVYGNNLETIPNTATA